MPRFPPPLFLAELAGRTLPRVRAVTFPLVARTHGQVFARWTCSNSRTCQLLERYNPMRKTYRVLSYTTGELFVTGKSRREKGDRLYRALLAGIDFIPVFQFV